MIFPHQSTSLFMYTLLLILVACCTGGWAEIRHLLTKVEPGGPTKHVMACWKGLWEPVTMGIVWTFVRAFMRLCGPHYLGFPPMQIWAGHCVAAPFSS